MILIAVADDHPIFRKGLVDVVAGFEGIAVNIEAANGKELIHKLLHVETKPDICILDINMPEMNGYETAAAIRQQYPKIGILALSMYDTEFNIIKMLRNGANGYILKDDDPEKLKQAINSIYTTGFFLSNLVTGRMLTMLNDLREPYPLDLSENEHLFLKLCCTELTYKEIAEKMNLSPRTIDGYRETLFQKLQVTTRTGLVVFAIKAGLGAEKSGQQTSFVKNKVALKP